MGGSRVEGHCPFEIAGMQANVAVRTKSDELKTEAGIGHAMRVKNTRILSGTMRVDLYVLSS